MSRCCRVRERASWGLFVGGGQFPSRWPPQLVAADSDSGQPNRGRPWDDGLLWSTVDGLGPGVPMMSHEILTGPAGRGGDVRMAYP